MSSQGAIGQSGGEGGDGPAIQCVGAPVTAEERAGIQQVCCETWREIPTADAEIGPGFVAAVEKSPDVGNLTPEDKEILREWPPVQLRAVRQAMVEVCCAQDQADPKIHKRKGPAKTGPAVRIDITETDSSSSKGPQTRKIRTIEVTFQHPDLKP